MDAAYANKHQKEGFLNVEENDEKKIPLSSLEKRLIRFERPKGCLDTRY